MPEFSELLEAIGIRSHHHARTAPSDAHTDLIWLLDNTAYISDDTQQWTAEFIAAYFAKNTGEEVSKAVAEISQKLGAAKDEQTRKLIEKRVQPFFNLILPGRSCSITHGEATKKVGASNATSVDQADLPEVEEGDHTSASPVNLGPSNASGISTNHITISGPNHDDGNVMTSTASPPLTCVPSRTTFARATGWAVISDIDDTIKKTLTHSATGILKTTFAEEPVPIAGMPEFYRHMVGKLLNPPFWYLSASPYNLYQFLHEFRDTHYPFGAMVLREASWMNVGGFVSSLTKGTKEYKVAEMDKIHARFLKRQMICLGDSTQSDPEAYATVFRKYPGWVKGVFIRKVKGVTEVKDGFTPGDDEKKRNSSERFEKAFEDVPKEVWCVFEDPKELYERLDAIVARG
ncbi:MAG: hypothetical protein M1828_003776 [Chrysothrix sp. TS-e1954]|nr:MAG: hypothetical protein M1828_003776 [Chrysothrix sp. TS-e1954]